MQRPFLAFSMSGIGLRQLLPPHFHRPSLRTRITSYNVCYTKLLREGEISNFATPASGHWYFSLKDETAQIRAVMFRAQSRLTAFKPDNGLKIICRGRVSLYPQRGELQLIVDAMEPKGVGSLQLAFEQLKQRLSAEGLFDPSKKRALPPFPKTIGVVTSATGAAIHDILTVLRRRAAGVRVLLRPVRVQGVITSYSIHYTKLYEASAKPSRSH